MSLFAGSGTFLLLAYKSLQWGKTHFTRQTVQSRMVMVWAFRYQKNQLLFYAEVCFQNQYQEN